MKKLIPLLVVLWFPTTLVAGNPHTHIDQVLVKFVAAFNDGDAATVASFYSEDAALFPPGADRVDGRSAIQAFWQGAIDSGMTIVDLHAIEVDARQDIAGEVGVFILSVPGDSGSTNVDGQYIVIWKRVGHTWQLYRDIWNTK
jgi:ketosteroid isomerase-like protein